MPPWPPGQSPVVRFGFWDGSAWAAPADRIVVTPVSPLLPRKALPWSSSFPLVLLTGCELAIRLGQRVTAKVRIGNHRRLAGPAGPRPATFTRADRSWRTLRRGNATAPARCGSIRDAAIVRRDPAGNSARAWVLGKTMVQEDGFRPCAASRSGRGRGGRSRGTAPAGRGLRRRSSG